MADGVDKYVPADVLAAAREFVQGQFNDLAERGIGWVGSGSTGEDNFGPGNVVWDDRRITELTGPYYETADGVEVELWSVGYETHTATPERVVLAGGSYIGEDDWGMIGYYGCDVLFFQAEGEDRIVEELRLRTSGNHGKASALLEEYSSQELEEFLSDIYGMKISG